MKRLCVLALAFCLLAAGLAGCGKKEEEPGSGSSAIVSPAPATPAPASPAPVQKAKAVRIHADGGLNIRAEASTEGEILGLAEDNTLLPLLVETPADGWYQVEYDGKTAYVFAEYAVVEEITLDEYNRLKTGAASSPSPSPSSTASLSGGLQSSSSSAPESSSGLTSSSQLSIGSEDGE